MCIRDRAQTDQVARLGLKLGIELDGIGVILARLPSNRTVAVSYTHLRAHETVLDLVCRLLLEKKKKKNKTKGTTLDLN